MAVTLFYTITDADGDASTVTIPIDDTNFTLANSAQVISQGWSAINALISGHLLTAGYTVEVDITGFINDAADVLSDVQEKAEFVFRSVNGFIKRISLPTVLETMFVGGGSGKEVDTAQTAVATFITRMTDGLANVPIPAVPADYCQPSTSHGEDLDTFVEGHQAWGRNRR